MNFARFALAALALFLPALPAEVKKIKVESLTPIPKEAEVVCESTRDGEKSKFDFPSNELYVADAEGGHLTRVTQTRALYNHFAVSPNRKMIAANRYDAGDTSKNGRIEASDRKTLWVIDLEHKEEWPLAAEYDAGLGGIDWTPDREYIVASMRVDGLIDIYRIHPDGSGFQNLTKNVNKLLHVDDDQKFVSDVSVSFDGKWIVFLYSNRRIGPHRIAMMRMDGSEAKFVTDGGGSTVKSAGGGWTPGDFDPEFSPDGQFVVFQRSTGAPGGLGLHQHGCDAHQT